MNSKLKPYKGKSNWKKWTAIAVTLLILLCAAGLYIIGLLDINLSGSSKEPDNKHNTNENEITAAPVTPIDYSKEEGVSETEETEQREPLKLRPDELKFTYIGLNSINFKALTELKEKHKSGEINSVIIEFKDNAGNILTDNENIKSGLSQFIEGLQDDNIYTIASIYAFRDNKRVLESMKDAIMYNQKTLWLDNNKKRWLNPYKEGARQYIKDVVSEALSYGFDEIMLFECNFPSSGLISRIYYEDKSISKNEQINSFLTEILSIIK